MLPFFVSINIEQTSFISVQNKPVFGVSCVITAGPFLPINPNTIKDTLGKVFF